MNDNNHPQNSDQNHKTQIHKIYAGYAGPLPPPSMLKEYENIYPGFAERIMVMAEKRSDTQQSQEKFKLKSDSNHRLRRDIEAYIGQIFAFLIALAAIGFGTYAITKGFSVAGSFIGLLGISGIVTAFLSSRKF